MPAVRMYTTAVCPYCLRAKALLRQRGVEHIEEILIDADAAAAADMGLRPGRRTVPRIFIGERHVGGGDELYALDASGGLRGLLDA